MRRTTSVAWFGIVLLLCFLAALFCLVYPVYVIRPFRYQGAAELSAALAVLRYRPVLMAIFIAVSVAAVVFYWRAQQSRWRRVIACVGAALVCAFAALSRINIYELMFHPVVKPEFVAVGETKLDADEKVLAVDLGGKARAYPIRSISYHHIVNDVVNGVPIVATY